MMADSFTCAMCGETFTKGRPDADAVAEMETWFGEVPVADRAVVCKDCFKKIHPADHPRQVAAARRQGANL